MEKGKVDTEEKKMKKEKEEERSKKITSLCRLHSSVTHISITALVPNDLNLQLVYP
jgi:hypothetical protein